MLIILISCARGLLLVCILVDLSSVESLNYVSVKALKQNYQIFCVPTRILKASSKAARTAGFFAVFHIAFMAVSSKYCPVQDRLW